MVAVVAGVDIADAVQRQIILIVARTIDADVSQAGMTSDFIIIRVDNSGSKASQGEITAPVDRNVLYLFTGDRCTPLGALSLKLLSTGD